MLSLIKWVIKSAIFAAIVLIAANLVKWDGKTISDQVKTQLSHAERADLTSKVKIWAGSVTSDARRGASRRPGSPAIAPTVSEGRTSAAPPREQVDDSERQKLRALIRELNTAPGEE